MSSTDNSSPRPPDDRAIRLMYKGNRCQCCGKTVEQVQRRWGNSRGCFEFNHLDPSRKDPNYQNLIRRTLSSEQLDELDKCVLLCCECHAIFHAQRLHGNMTITTTLADGSVKKEDVNFKGIFDFALPKIHLFTDDQSVIGLYHYQIGNDEIETRLARELEESLLDLTLTTRSGKILRVWDSEGLVYTAAREDANDCKVLFNVRFPLVKCEFHSDQPEHTVLWVRNGSIVERKRHIRKTGIVSLILEYSEINKNL